MTKKKRICLAGYYGQNLGDILFLEILDKYFGSNPRAEIVSVLSFGSELDRVIYQQLRNKNVKIFYSQRLKRLRKYRELFAHYRSIDVLVWGGGSCFQNKQGGAGLGAFLLAFLMGKKIVYLGVGIERITRLYPLLVLLMSIAISDQFIVRDASSYKSATDLTRAFGLLRFFRNKFKIIPDLSVLTDQKFSFNVERENRLIIGFRDDDEGAFGKTIFDLIENCKVLFEFEEILIVPIDDEKDLVFNRKIFDDLVSKGFIVEFRKGLTLHEKLDLFSSASLLLTSRLHAALLSLFFQTPFYVMNYSKKIQVLSEIFGFQSRVLEKDSSVGQDILTLEAVNKNVGQMKVETLRILDELF